MDVREQLASLTAILSAERDAIRRCDGAAVGELAGKKERAARSLAAIARADLAPFAKELDQLRGDLRRNVVLLAIARDGIKSVLTAKGVIGAKGKTGVRLSAAL